MNNTIKKCSNKSNSKADLKEKNVITQDNKRLITDEFNDTYVNYDKDKTIIELFEEQVREVPDKIALQFEDNKITYKMLNERANSLARLLKEKGIGPDYIVGILMERSINMIVGIISILKAGGAYLPIDPEYPEKRIEYILKDSEAKIVLTEGSFREKIKEVTEILDLDDKELYEKNNTNLNNSSKGENLAYVIYTSGTTGKPKGVMIENSAIVNYALYARNEYLNSQDECMPLYTSIAFDLTITSVFAPLISGNKIIIYKNKDIDILMNEVFQSDENTVIKVTPAHLILLKEMNNVNMNIKKLIVGGEELKEALAKDISEIFSHKIEIINEYGPTEGTVGCIAHVYDFRKEYKNTVLIGKPIRNFKVYIVNEENELVTIGHPGEICISGSGLARGYLNNPKLTEEKFIQNPLNSEEKIYKTGDIGKWLLDGNIEFLGRVDEQVKIRGYRVELSEIDNNIRKNEEIKDVAVIARENSMGENEVVAYVICNNNEVVEKIRDGLVRELPQYMVPSKIIKVHDFPLTANGKLDKNALLQIKEVDKFTYVAPTNPLEEEISILWSEMLDVEDIGIDDNFLEVGGHSLVATKIVYKINESYNIDLSLVEFLTNGLTVRTLSEIIEEKLFNSISEEELAAMLDEIED